VGTALALARLGRFQPQGDEARIVLEELAGPVPVTVRYENGAPAWAEFMAPARPQVGERLDSGPIARALGLELGDLVTGGAMPCMASCGAAFLVVEVAGLAALGRARDNGIAALGENGVLIVSRETGDPEVDLRVRMYAPQHGITEDPATGSAAAALAGLLASCAEAADGEFRWRIVQGIELGRPSLIEASAEKRASEVVAVRIAGTAVFVMEGWIEVG
jgi:trans-2,3-dihydro-3-hydroxyanthranilate isomerase